MAKSTGAKGAPKKKQKRTKKRDFLRSQRKEGATDNATEVNTGVWDFAATGNLQKPCMPFKKDGETKPVKPGTAQLVMVPAGGAKGLPPGLSLRLCYAERQPGPAIPVQSPKQAADFAMKFKTCVAGDLSKASTCAADIAEGKGAVLAGVRRRRAQPDLPDDRHFTPAALKANKVELDAIKERAASVLGWSLKDANKAPLHTLQTLVRGKDRQLDRAIAAMQRDGSHLLLPDDLGRAPRRRRSR